MRGSSINLDIHHSKVFSSDDDVNLWYFKLRLFDLTEKIVWNIYDFGLQRFKNIRAVSKAQFFFRAGCQWIASE